MRMEKNGLLLRLENDGSFAFGRDGVWFEQPCRGFAASDVQTGADGIRYRLAREDGLELSASLRLLEDAVELSLEGEGAEFAQLLYPGATQTIAGDIALLPIGGGFAFPVDDATIPVLPEEAFAWSPSQCMGMVGLLRGDGWLVTAIEDPADVMVCRKRDESGHLRPHLRWLPENGKLGYARRVRFMLGARGALSAACRAYRAYRQGQGLVVPLREKLRRLPDGEKLLGAADIWLWHDRYEEVMYSVSTEEIDVRNADAVLAVARDMRENGLEHAIFGMFFQADCEASAALREMGYLVTKYDNYSDVLPGDIAPLIPRLRVEQCDFTRRRAKNWPQDVRVVSDGSLCGAWALRGTDGVMHPQNSLCARAAARDARKEVAQCAQKYGCNAWFIDVMGGGLQECFSPEHPMTRRQSRQYILQALGSMMDADLVSGTEEGVEFCVPAICYAEGRMSPQQYRICWKESGRRKAHLYAPEEHEENFDRFMLNPAYRVPLWELVYHDCTVSYWYWGDSSNCCPELLPERDLFNALYGTPPLYSFHTGEWEKIRGQVLASQARACPVARKVALEAMTDFSYLTPDKQVQRTQFADGTQVTVNFSRAPFAMEDGGILAPGDYRMH